MPAIALRYRDPLEAPGERAHRPHEHQPGEERQNERYRPDDHRARSEREAGTKMTSPPRNGTSLPLPDSTATRFTTVFAGGAPRPRPMPASAPRCPSARTSTADRFA